MLSTFFKKFNHNKIYFTSFLFLTSTYFFTLKTKNGARNGYTELEYSVSLDSLSESEEYYIQSFENILETEELEYSVESNSGDENDRSSESEMCESLQDLLLLKPYDFETNIKDLPSDSNNQQK